MSRYLYAFDLSMDCTGLVIFDIDTFKHIHITSFKTNEKETHGKRLNYIKTEIQKLFEQYPVYEVAIERGFTRFNVSTQVIYRVHGVINEMFKDCNQKYYPPKQVKEAILNGNATKKALQNEIKKRYPEVKFSITEVKDKKTKEIRFEENEDESDAFAVGLTHLIKMRNMEWEKAIVNKVRKSKKKKSEIIEV